MAVVSKQTIEDFYQNDKIAVIGASRDSKKYGHHLLRDLLAKDINAIPVNPNADEILNQKCFHNIKDINDGVTAAIAVVPAEAQEQVVLDAAEAGIKTLWIHEHVMKGVSNPKVTYLCEQQGMQCIVGFCPFMFLPKAGFPHNIHKGIMNLFGALPK